MLLDPINLNGFENSHSFYLFGFLKHTFYVKQWFIKFKINAQKRLNIILKLMSLFMYIENRNCFVERTSEDGWIIS